MEWNNETILVTGGGSGIGLAMAARLAARGNSLLLCGRRKDVLRDACGVVKGAHTFVCDLEDESERVRLSEWVKKEHPDLSVVIHNAGVQNHSRRLTTGEDWARHRQEIRINLDAPIHLTLLLLPHLLSRPSASLVYITSGLAFVPLAFVPTYSATKAALHSFTQSIRYQVRGSSVRVCEIAPPAVNTDLGGPGKHTFGVSVDAFADHAVSRLVAGDEEFGYETSEGARLADNLARGEIFEAMNGKMAGLFS